MNERNAAPPNVSLDSVTKGDEVINRQLVLSIITSRTVIAEYNFADKMSITKSFSLAQLYTHIDKTLDRSASHFETSVIEQPSVFSFAFGPSHRKPTVKNKL